MHYRGMAIDHDAIRQRIRDRIAADEDMTMRNISLAAFNSDSALHKFLTGANKSIRLVNLDAVAEALKVSLAWLLFGSEEKAQAISPDDVARMVGDALAEIRPGMNLREIVPVVSTALHGHLASRLAGANVQSLAAARAARNEAAQPGAAGKAPKKKRP